MKNGLEIQEFFVEGDNQRASHVLLHIAEPITQTEKDKGYFFAIIEVNGSYSEQISQLQQIVDDIEIRYYSEENSNINNYFESILQEINQQSHNVLQYTDNKLHVLVGIIQKRHLVLAYHGEPNAYLFFAGKEGLRSTQVIEPEESENHDQLFSSVIEGDMKDDDYLYVSTPSVSEHFSADRVRKIIQNRATKQGALHIQKVLDNLKDEQSFGGVIFHTPKLQLEVKRFKNIKADDVGSQASMDELVNTTRNTADTLSPSLLKNIKDKFTTTFQKNDTKEIKKKETLLKKTNHGSPNQSYGKIETNYRANSRDKKQKLSEKILIILGKGLVLLFTGIFFVIKKIFSFVLHIIKTIFFIITNKSGQRTVIMDDLKSNINERRERLRNISLISKVLFIALIILAIIFLGSIIYIKIKENKEAKIAQYDTILVTITEKKDDAEAKLLYGEEGKALEILENASKLVETLPQKTEEEIAKYNEMKSSIDEILNKLQKLNNVETELIADLNSQNPDGDLNKLAILGEDIFTYSHKDDNMYQINIISKETKIKNHDNQKNLISSDTPKEDDKMIFLSKDSNVYEYTKLTESLSTKDISFPQDSVDITQIFVYNRRLYTLSPKSDQIFKHNPTQTGYDRGSAWITQNSDSLKNAISLAVDGNIFVLTDDAHILNFYSGEQKNFEIQGVHPELESPTKIWTYANSDYLYLLEPKNKRVILLDKDGNFIEQYTSNIWKEPQDMLIDEDNKLVYILDDNKIYKFSTK